MLVEGDGRERLGESVCSVVLRRYVLHLHHSFVNLLTDEEVLDVDVLGTLMLGSRVLDDGDRALVVLEDERRSLRTMEIGKKTTKPDGLLRGMAESHELRFRRRKGNSLLTLGLPTDGRPTQEHGESRG